MNKRPSTFLAGLALAGSLVVSGCSAGTANSADSSEVAATSSVTTAVPR